MHSSYAEIIEDSAEQGRSSEREALLHSIAVMEDADRDRSNPGKRAMAIYTVNRLWAMMLEDLASPQNGYPPQLRAQIVSIGIFILRQCEVLRSDRTKDFSVIAEISRIIEKGLA